MLNYLTDAFVSFLSNKSSCLREKSVKMRQIVICPFLQERGYMYIKVNKNRN